MAKTWKPEELGAVREVLVRLYPSTSKIRILLSDAGLDDGRFDYNGSAVDVWGNALLVLANQEGQVERVLRLAEKDDPSNQGLAALLQTAASTSPPNVTPTPPVSAQRAVVSAPAEVAANAATSTWKVSASASVDFNRLRGEQWRALQDALLDAFPSNSELQQFVKFRLDVNLATIAATGSLTQDVFRVIEWSQAKGWTKRLYQSARAERPDNPSLAAFGLTVQPPAANASAERVVVAGGALEEILSAVPTLRLTALLKTLGAIQGRVCRVEIESTSVGTGFLIGPSAVMTNHHVVRRIITKEALPTDVVLRFDCYDDGGGTSVRLADDWLIDDSPYAPFEAQDPDAGVPSPDVLDYAVLRTRGRPSESNLGDKASPNASTRGFIEVTSLPRLRDDTALFVVQHPDGRPQEIAIQTRGVIGYNANRTRMKHRVNTEHGSSGSPVFDFYGNLVALHHAGDPKQLPVFNQAIPVDKIFDLLDARGKLDAIRR